MLNKTPFGSIAQSPAMLKPIEELQEMWKPSLQIINDSVEQDDDLKVNQFSLFPKKDEDKKDLRKAKRGLGNSFSSSEKSSPVN